MSSLGLLPELGASTIVWFWG